MVPYTYIPVLVNTGVHTQHAGRVLIIMNFGLMPAHAAYLNFTMPKDLANLTAPEFSDFPGTRAAVPKSDDYEQGDPIMQDVPRHALPGVIAPTSGMTQQTNLDGDYAIEGCVSVRRAVHKKHTQDACKQRRLLHVAASSIYPLSIPAESC